MRKRQARAVQELTGQRFRSVLNAIDAGTVADLPGPADAVAAAADLVNGAPAAAIAHLAAARLNHDGVFAIAGSPYSPTGLRFTAGGDEHHAIIDLDDTAHLTVITGGSGVEVRTAIPAPISDPLAVATRLADRVIDVADMWNDTLAA